MKGVLSSIGVVLLTFSFAIAQSKQPNIIWLVSEDQSARHLYVTWISILITSTRIDMVVK